MTLLDSSSPEDFRARLRDHLAERLPADWAGMGALDPESRQRFLVSWREELRESRLLAPTWPVEYGGGGLGLAEQAIIGEEFVRAGVPALPHPNDNFSFVLFGPTLLRWGSEEQKAFFLPRMISGEHRWAQGYSEPDAGSDLFNLRTRARVDGDQWVVDGQKTWQTDGQYANWIFALVRTEPDTPGGKGISMLMLPVDQPGIEVRPIRTMTGKAEFTEVFFDGATTSLANIVGPRGHGARVAMTLLGFERASASAALYAGYRIELDRLVSLMRDRGADRDPVVRQRLAWCHGKVEMLKHLGRRILDEALEGGSPGAESSFLKLYESEYHAEVTQLAVDVLGMDATVWRGEPGVASLGPDPLGSSGSPAAWINQYLTSRAALIYGGSTQMQLNTIGERVLDLPREERPTATAGGVR